MEQFEKSLSKRQWYEKARVKIDSFIEQLDPALTVRVIEVDVLPEEGARYSTPALSFESSSDPRLNWTMEIEESDDYIERRLLPAIKKIYDGRKKELMKGQN